MSPAPSHVGDRAKSGQHLLVASLSHFDPNLTFGGAMPFVRWRPRRRLSLGALNATPSTSVAASMMPYLLTSAMWSWTSRWRGLAFRPN